MPITTRNIESYTRSMSERALEAQSLCMHIHLEIIKQAFEKIIKESEYIVLEQNDNTIECLYSWYYSGGSYNYICTSQYDPDIPAIRVTRSGTTGTAAAFWRSTATPTGNMPQHIQLKESRKFLISDIDIIDKIALTLIQITETSQIDRKTGRYARINENTRPNNAITNE